MWHKILIFLTFIVTSFYYFPFIFKFLPAANTKMVMAGIGLVLMLFQGARAARTILNVEIGKVSLYAIAFSLISLCAIVINETPDYAYASYVISMWVWLSAAFVLCTLIKTTHSELSIELVSKYLIAVCVMQCLMALIIDMNEPVKAFVDAHIEQGQDFLNETNVERLYGLGANLDVAGIRFSLVLVLIANILLRGQNQLRNLTIGYYVAAFIIIAVIGNMIARTTIVGVGVSLAMTVAYVAFDKSKRFADYKKLWLWSACLIVVAVAVSVFFYHNNTVIQENIRFAFEGFFNYFEKGEWSIASNERLATMYVWPETLKTWIIGDGYFSNPINTDPYFIGKETGGYYMGTDVGYLRLIFYSGLCGLISFSIFLIVVCATCAKRFGSQKMLMWFLLLVGFIVWFKVATDVFLIFALFLCIEKEENDEYNEKRLLKDENSLLHSGNL